VTSNPDWQGPGDPLYPLPPQHEGWRRQPMLTLKDVPISNLFSEASARWPTPIPTDDLDWT
jgi:hypothetical protein